MLMNRRNFLKLLGTSGAVAYVGELQQVLAQSEPGSFVPNSLIDQDPTTHVMSRLAFGPKAELLEHIRAIGVDAFIEEQLSPETIDDSAIAPRLRSFPDLDKNAGELIREYEGQAGNVAAQLTGNWIVRAMYSQRQLYERIVHFWSDHFSIFFGGGQIIFLKVDDERDVVRQHGMGRFRDLLGASAHSPAILVYLDNAVSTKEAPNENYARELMELHTMGIDGGYTEHDVKEVARCFTGWTVMRPGRRNQGDGLIAFRFDPAMHDDGEKVVLGQTIPAGGGEADGEIVLDILASHPSTARFVSTKMIRRFVADNPPETLVEACTQTFLEMDGDIRSVLRTIFTSDEFWAAGPKFKRPFEYTMSVLRVLNYNIESLQQFHRAFREVMLNMGHLPFNRATPDGYPDVQEAWTDNLLTRWNIAIAAAHGGIPGATASLRPLLEAHDIPLEAEPIVNFLGELFYRRPLTDGESSVILGYVNEGDPYDVERLQDAIALLLAAPVFQYR